MLIWSATQLIFLNETGRTIITSRTEERLDSK